MKRVLITLSAMAIASAATLIIKDGSIREIAGLFCLSLVGIIAATLLDPPTHMPDTFAGRNEWHGEQAEAQIKARKERRGK